MNPSIDEVLARVAEPPREESVGAGGTYDSPLQREEDLPRAASKEG